MRDLIDQWTGGFRLTLWLANPNDAAALLALFICLCACLALGRNRWIVCIACVAIFLASSLLGFTASRGGTLSLLVGLLCGLSVCAWQRRWIESGKFCAMILVVVMSAFWTGGSLRDRTVEMVGGEDGSTEARLLIYQHVPAMLAGGPGGWGWGRAADAYMQWFQPVSDLRIYLNLTSTHFTWMVEGGIFFSIFYLVAWHVVLGMAWIGCWRGGESPAAYAPAVLAGLICAYLLGYFNHCGDNWEFWIPCAVILVLLLLSFFRRTTYFPARKRLLCTVALPICAFTTMVVLLLGFIPDRHTPASGRLKNGFVWLGEGDLVGIAAPPDLAVVGLHYGKQLRMRIASLSENDDRRAVAVAWRSVDVDSGTLPSAPWTLAGNTALPATDGIEKIIWLNPPALEQVSPELLKTFLEAEERQVLWGVARRDASPVLWEALKADHASLHLIPLFGAGSFAQEVFVGSLTNSLEF